jgi:hypothetical protein
LPILPIKKLWLSGCKPLLPNGMPSHIRLIGRERRWRRLWLSAKSLNPIWRSLVDLGTPIPATCTKVLT